MENLGLEVVRANLLYLVPNPLYEHSKPYHIAGKPPADTKQTNQTFAPKETHIINARGIERSFSLEKNGFQWVDYPLKSAIETTDDCHRYMGEMEEFLKEHLKAEHVCAYDFVVSVGEN